MIPALAIMVGGSVLQGMMGDRAKAKQAKAQNKLNLQQNRENFNEAQRTVLSLEVQRAALRQQTAKTLDVANRVARSSKGSLSAAAAASGVKGANVDAIAYDIEADYQERKYENEQQHLYAEYDISNQQTSVLSQARLGMTPMQRSGAVGLGGHLAAGALNAATVYAGQYFKFGSTTDNVSTGG